MRDHEILTRNPLCMYEGVCQFHGKALLGPVRPWPEGGGYQRTITCCRRDCHASGEQSTNEAHTKKKGGKIDGIVLPSQLRVKRTTVVNRKQTSQYDVYVGRPTKWGNPWKINERRTRVDCLNKFAYWLAHRSGITLVEIERELKGKVLACWCWPEPCHAELYASLADGTPFPAWCTSVTINDFIPF